jgi:hypothetical protein
VERQRRLPGVCCAGLASRYEDDRLTEDDRDALPDRINENLSAYLRNLCSRPARKVS